METEPTEPRRLEEVMNDGLSVPEEKMAELTRQRALMDGVVEVYSEREHWSDYNDKWDVIKEASFDEIEYADGDLHVWFETTTTVQEQTRKKTFNHPAESKTVELDTALSMMWDLQAENEVGVTIEAYK